MKSPLLLLCTAALLFGCVRARAATVFFADFNQPSAVDGWSFSGMEPGDYGSTDVLTASAPDGSEVMELGRGSAAITATVRGSYSLLEAPGAFITLPAGTRQLSWEFQGLIKRAIDSRASLLPLLRIEYADLTTADIGGPQFFSDTWGDGSFVFRSPTEIARIHTIRLYLLSAQAGDYACVDNFRVSAAAPEPSSLAALAGALTGAFSLQRLRMPRARKSRA